MNRLLAVLLMACVPQTANADMLPDFDTLWDYSNPAATEKSFTEILRQAEDVKNSPYQVELLTQIARAQGLQGQFPRGHATLDRAAALLTEGMRRPRARLLLERGRLFNSAGEPAKAFPLFEEAWKEATAARAPRFEVDAVHMMAIAAGTPEEQIRWNLKGLEIVEAEPSQRGWLHALYNNLGEAYAAAGDFAHGLEAFQKLAKLRREDGKPPDPYNLKDQSRMLRQMRRLDEAMAIMEPLWKKFSPDEKKVGWIGGEYAECLAAAGRLQEAVPVAAKAYDNLKNDSWVRQNDPAFLRRLEKIARGP